MNRLLSRVLLVLALCFASGGVTLAQEVTQSAVLPRIELVGPGLDAATLTREGLSGLPPVERDVAFQTAKGESRGRYKGVLLWDVLVRAGLMRGIAHNAELRRTLLVTGRDGYAVAFSVGEFAPDFGDMQAMIAFERDGRPLPPDEGLRLVVPGDKRGARNVFDVVRIEVH